MNRRILRWGSKLQGKGDSETMLCRILVTMLSLRALFQRLSYGPLIWALILLPVGSVLRVAYLVYGM